MFNLPNISLKDYIIILLVIILSFFVYKYFNSSNHIKKLETQINDLEKKININDKLLLTQSIKQKNIIITSESKSNFESDTEYESESEYISESNHYKSNKPIESFNNKKNDNLFCDNNMCFLTKDEKIESEMYIPVDLKTIVNQIYDSGVHIDLFNSRVPNFINIPDNIDNYTNINNHNLSDNSVKVIELDNSEHLDGSIKVEQVVELEHKEHIEYDDSIHTEQINEIEHIKVEKSDGLEIKVEQIDESTSSKYNINNKSEFIQDLEQDLEQDLTCHNSQVEITPISTPLITTSLVSIPLDATIIAPISISLALDRMPERQDVPLVKTVPKAIVDKYSTMNLTAIKNIAKKNNIKLTENGKSKTRTTLIQEINRYQNISMNI